MRNVTGFFVVVMLCLAMLAPMPLEASVVIEFQQGAATGGDISFFYNDAGKLINAYGWVPVSTMIVRGTAYMDGSYDLEGPLATGSDSYAKLNFQTAYQSELWGYIPRLGVFGIGASSPSTIIAGSNEFQNVSIQMTSKSLTLSASGIDYKNPDLLTALGIIVNDRDNWPSWNCSFSLTGEALMVANGYKITGAVLTNTDAAPVPVPAAVWLLGSGLIGLIGIRKIRK